MIYDFREKMYYTKWINWIILLIKLSLMVLYSIPQVHDFIHKSLGLKEDEDYSLYFLAFIGLTTFANFVLYKVAKIAEPTSNSDIIDV